MMLNIATIGTSMISDNLIEVLREHQGARYVGTLSRNSERAREWTESHGGTTPFTDLNELAASPEVDAVYVGSPNGLHASQAMALIAGGKHVLIEKSFAANRGEAKAVFDAAEQAGVVALEAMRPLHDPAFNMVRAKLEQAGRVRRANIHFGKYSSRYDDVLAGKHTNIFDCAMASGSLMDIGVYCVEPAIRLFGAPERVVAGSVLLDESTRGITNGAIDGAGTALACYPDKVVELAYSKITNDDLPVQIETESATLTVDSISIPTHLTIKHRGVALRGDAKAARNEVGGSTEEIDLPCVPNTMAYELDDFIKAVEAVRLGCAPAAAQAGPYGTVGDFQQITLASLEVMDEIRRQSGIVFAADAKN